LGIGADPRIGYSFIYPGCGYGGSCFPKDIQALIRMARDQDYEPELLKAVHAINLLQKQVLLEKIKHHYGSINGKTFAIWGLAFKPNTDDIREAPSRVLIEGLWAAGAKVQAYDPEAMQVFAKAYSNHSALKLYDSALAATENADALVIMTEWPAFRSPDFQAIKQQLNAAVIFDGRNLYDSNYLTGLGFTYYSIGRKAQQHSASEILKQPCLAEASA
ncbi:MAG: UDP-glucose 6-dehydrogenase, partial [Gammaproteobacteria bacterium]|nr:UDP-glucose 6-dehydrogenase [Gammaproteobacteria bacterium]